MNYFYILILFDSDLSLHNLYQLEVSTHLDLNKLIFTGTKYELGNILAQDESNEASFVEPGVSNLGCTN